MSSDRIATALSVLNAALTTSPTKSSSVRRLPTLSRQQELERRYVEDQPMVINEHDGHRPWRRDQFLRRLHTFQVAARWFAKPPELSPLRCAQYGWSNSDIDELRCEQCQATVRYCDEGGGDFPNLKESHVEGCPWLSVHCFEHFLRSPELLDDRAMRQAIILRARSALDMFASLSDRLPGRWILSCQDWSVQKNGDELIKANLSDRELLDNPQQLATIEMALLLACLGWHHRYGMLHCEMCARSFSLVTELKGVPVLTIDEPQEASEEVVGDVLKVLIDQLCNESGYVPAEEKPSSVDAWLQHRHFCPWTTDWRCCHALLTRLSNSRKRVDADESVVSMEQVFKRARLALTSLSN